MALYDGGRAAGQTEATAPAEAAGPAKAAVKSKTKSAPKQAARKKVDVGKVMALTDAGWKPKDIAGDMGLSYSTVWAVVKRELEKRQDK